MKKLGLLLTLLVASLPSVAQTQRPAVYIAPQNGFETYLGAAMAKKGVPIDVVTDQTKAVYLLKAAPVEIKQETTGAKITRCLFASCAGIERSDQRAVFHCVFDGRTGNGSATDRNSHARRCVRS